MRRTIPTYAMISGLVQKDVSLRFRSYKPRFVRSAIKWVFQAIFNSSTYMKELYEEWFCWLIPCYEVRYILEVERRAD